MELKQSGEPSALTFPLPLVSGVPDPGQCTPCSFVPAPLQNPSRNPSAELSWDPAAAPLGRLGTLGGARRAPGPGSSVLLCHFIEERWHRGVSTSAAAGGTRSLSAALEGLGTGCFILWDPIWTGMAGTLHCRVGRAEVVGAGQILHPALCHLALGHSPRPGARGRERTEGPGRWGGGRRGFEPCLTSAEHSPLLRVPC